jgi:hypothetical protein
VRDRHKLLPNDLWQIAQKVSSNLQDILEYIRQICTVESYNVREVLDNSRRLLTWLRSEPEAQKWFERGSQTSMLATKISYVKLINNTTELINKIEEKNHSE